MTKNKNKPEIISREDARAKGLKHYYSGAPCTYGHDSPRTVRNSTCVECQRGYNSKKKADKAIRSKALSDLKAGSSLHVFRTAFREAITVKDVQDIAKKLVTIAKSGDLEAIKIFSDKILPRATPDNASPNAPGTGKFVVNFNISKVEDIPTIEVIPTVVVDEDDEDEEQSGPVIFDE